MRMNAILEAAYRSINSTYPHPYFSIFGALESGNTAVK
jgi:hypothetical protein